MKKLFLILLILLSASIFANAASINICVTQIDNVQEVVREPTQQFEDFVMDFCFDNGIIVCNEPINLEKNNVVANQKAFENAKNGFCDYLICFTIIVDPVVERAKSVEWKLTQISTNKNIASGNEKIVASKNGTIDEKNNLSIFTNKLMKKIISEM